MSGQREFLEQITSLLSECGIPFMVSGSLGSTHYGEPRSTNDIDFVIDPLESQLNSFVAKVSGDHYVSPSAATEALQHRSMFNVIDTVSGWKADLIIRKDRPFSVTEFERRTSTTLLGVTVDLASPEDIILSKLEWASRSGSERQFRDAQSVFVTMSKQLDLQYLRKWADELGLTDVLDQVISD